METLLKVSNMAGTSTDCSGCEYKEKLLRNVKREVKQIMEEAVTRKFVHEESSSVTALCAAVEACLSSGLRRRALGLFKSSSTTALLHKVGKSFEPAEKISKMLLDMDGDPNKCSSSSSDSATKLIRPTLQKKNSAGANQQTSTSTRYHWIRLALLEKQLAKIVDYLVQNSNKYYERDALVADQDLGSILSSLLVGPCALDYSKMKSQDHFWSDPPADELVQRHRISAAHSPNAACNTTPTHQRRPGLNFRRDAPSEDSVQRSCSLSASARDYVDSLHQSNRGTILYGKNNVISFPKDQSEPLAGYLSLHQVADVLTIKWTPNQLMNRCADNNTSTTNEGQDKSAYWQYALNVRLDEIVYVHCHQKADTGGTIILVGQDGVQRSPIHFPKGGHLLSFLSCLETGLLPNGQLDPPLWAQRGKGKVFPKLRRRGRSSCTTISSADSADSNGVIAETSEDEVEASDFVFRIISNRRHEAGLIAAQELLMEPQSPRLRSPWGWRTPQKSPRTPLPSASTSSTSSSKSFSIQEMNGDSITMGMSTEIFTSSIVSTTNNKVNGNNNKILPAGESLQVLCHTMKRQIISRAFYGWLAYCRHLRTVRTHLAGLVHSRIVTLNVPTNGSEGLTIEKWAELTIEGAVQDKDEVFRLTYFGGVAHEIRKEVWPYLLGHVRFGSDVNEREEQDKNVRRAYETTMSEWLAVEAIVRQRDREAMAATLAKLSSGSHTGEEEQPTTHNRSMSNEVFEDNLSVGSSSSEELKENEEHGEKDEKNASNVEEQQNHVDAPVSPDEGMEDGAEEGDDHVDEISTGEAIIVTNASTDSGGSHPEDASSLRNPCDSHVLEDDYDNNKAHPPPIHHIDLGISQEGKNDDESDEKEEDKSPICGSPASSQGGVYSTELLETFGLNLHRIDKDVQRCDRNYAYFCTDNLEKLRNVMCTYVWQHLDVGYMQGMCDLAAPLLVIFDDEAITYACFCHLMERMAANFPHGCQMDAHFANMRSLIQILDCEMFELMHQNGDYTHFYFCYRWFLLDFKRELIYDDVFSVWEVIWAARHVASGHLVLFLALALVQYYRDIILSNNMDFTDIIKFFNEMAEHHDAHAVLQMARDLVLQLQTLIENK